MLELGQLEKQHAEFEKRKVKLYVASSDNLEDSEATQKLFPYLRVIADPEQSLIKAMQVAHAGAAPDGKDTAAPTTFVFDGAGTVRWVYRPDRITDRLSPEALLQAIDHSK